jgi:tRNA (cmo5U34)-methyltransferase
VNQFVEAFSNPEAVAKYAEGPPRFVPGFSDLHRMATILLSERAGHDARVLVLGAGGGLELSAFAKAQPGWTFDGIDPAPAMLNLARQTLGPDAARVRLHEGYIDVAPEGPFDAATCLLTLHFLDRPERLRTARKVHRRLRPGAPFVVAHSSFPQDGDERSRWLSRYAAFALGSGADPVQVAKMHEAVEAHLNLMNPEDDEALLREAGFAGVSMFYAAFTWRGWVAYA